MSIKCGACGTTQESILRETVATESGQFSFLMPKRARLSRFGRAEWRPSDRAKWRTRDRAKMPTPIPDERRWSGDKPCRKMEAMDTHQISFAIRGMVCPRCALDFERVLTQLDGVVAAQVNYATERAIVMYDPARATAVKMVNAIRSIAYDTPVEHLTMHSDDLLYATSIRTVERMLENLEGVVRVTADLTAGNIALNLVPGHGRREDLECSFSGLRFHVAKANSVDGRLLFLARSLILGLVEVVVVWSAGAHAGLFLSPTSLHAPLVIVVLSLFALFGAGLPFFRFAIDAALAIASLPVGMLLPTPWLTNIGFVIATTLTTAWFMTRALTVWVFPHFGGMNGSARSGATAQAPMGVVSDGSRR
jgi:cation transport ATPase